MSRTICIGNRTGCGTVRGRPFRINGILFLVYRHPVTGLTFYAVDPETVRKEQRNDNA